MPKVMIGNRVNVEPGDAAFNVLTNLCDYFELGTRAGDDVWLEGEIVEGEFVFNGRLFMHHGEGGTVIDNFPKGPTPNGWTQARRADVEGYTLLDPRGELVFSYRIDGELCVVDLNLYRKDGSAAVHGGQGGLVVDVPFMLGRGGIRLE